MPLCTTRDSQLSVALTEDMVKMGMIVSMLCRSLGRKSQLEKSDRNMPLWKHDRVSIRHRKLDPLSRSPLSKGFVANDGLQSFRNSRVGSDRLRSESEQE